MNELLEILLRIAGVGLIALALVHVPVARRLGWRENSMLLTPMNASVFKVHAFFICVVLVMMGLPCLLEPQVFLVKSRAGLWISWSLAIFWAMRLYCQWFVYQADLWRGKRLETWVHVIFTAVWIALTSVFTACGLLQIGWL